MPVETIYLPEETYNAIRQLEESDAEIENFSQAVQEAVEGGL